MAITNFIPQIWSAALLTRFPGSEIVIPTVNRSYEGEARSGNRVNITTITTPTVKDYKAGGRKITPDALSDTQVPLLIDQEKAIAFLVDDVDRVQAAGSFDAVTADAARALVEDAESYVLGKMMAEGTDDNGDASTVDSPSKAFDAVKSLRVSLAKANVPATGRYLVVNPDFAGFLLAEQSKLTSADAAGSTGELRSGVLGNLLGFTALEQPLLNPTKPTAVAYHTSAVAYVNQIERVEALRDPESFSDIVRMLHVYGAKVIRPSAVRTYASA